MADHLIEQVESGTTRWRPLTVPPIVHVQPARLQHVLLVAPAERFTLAMEGGTMLAFPSGVG